MMPSEHKRETQDGGKLLMLSILATYVLRSGRVSAIITAQPAPYRPPPPPKFYPHKHIYLHVDSDHADINQNLSTLVIVRIVS